MIIRPDSFTNDAPEWQHPFFGSPRSAEPLITAVRRCVERDLGIHNLTVEALLPTLGNKVSAVTGIVEVHPSYLVTSDEAPFLSEGTEVRWMNPLVLGHDARTHPRDYSTLLALHATRLPFFGGSPRTVHSVALHEERATG